MGNRLSIVRKDNRLGNQELQDLGKAALRERDALLEERPDLMEFQEEIDRILNNAGGFENRMAVLAVMMEANLKELQKQISRLSSVSSRLSETYS
jgi:hypothetical protein